MAAAEGSAGRYRHVIAEGMNWPGSERHPHYGVRVCTTRERERSTALARVAPAPHTWEAAVERRINGQLPPLNPRPAPIRLRPYQEGRVEEIVAAYRRGAPGYALAYPTGTGKTYITVAAINEMAPERVLVIPPLSHCDEWRTIASLHGSSRTEWVVVNPDKLSRQFYLENAGVPLHELGEERARVAAAHGTPFTPPYDIVVVDESQILAHEDTLRSRLWRRILGWVGEGTPEVFTLHLSATGWTTPEETASVAHLLAYAAGVRCPSATRVETDYRGWCADQLGLAGLAKGADGVWHWSENEADVRRLTGLLYTGEVGATATRESLGLPDQRRRLELIELSPEDHAKYELEWAAFRDLIDGDGQLVSDPETALEKNLRAIQKAAEIKAPYVARRVIERLNDRYQIIIPARLIRTVHALRRSINDEAVRQGGKEVAVPLTGEHDVEQRTMIRQIFQSGRRPVIITSVLEAISLHAGQKGGGERGEDATDTPRETWFGDVLYGGKVGFQAEGRGSRDGREADAVYCVAVGTAEALAWARTFRKLANTRALHSSGENLYSDADISSFEEMAQELEDTYEAAQERRSLGGVV